MEVKYRLLVASFTITAILLVAIILFGSVLDKGRQNVLTTEFDKISEDFNELQTLTFLADSYDDELACLAFESKLHEMDSYLWDLGSTLDKYQSASEEFNEQSYYFHQKKLFNQHEMTYYLFTRNLVERCDISKTSILYFYKESESCSDCDAQSFILRDIGFEDKDANNDDRELAIFSFDTDLGIGSIDLLTTYYEFDDYPCLVINDKASCGLKSQEEIVYLLCKENDLAICN